MASQFDDGDWPPGATSKKPVKLAEAPPPPQAHPLAWLELEGKDPPQRRWAINGWLGYGHTTLLIGQGGIGKTLIAQQIGSHLSLGDKFIDEVPGRLKVLMWACEDDHDELWRRQMSIAVHLDAQLSAFQDFTLVPRYGHENQLMTTEFGKPVFTTRLIELQQQASDLHADVVILDNIAQLYGAGENDRPSVTKFMNALGGALKGCAILLLGHPSRSLNSEFSGSSAWENVARTRLYLGSQLPKDATQAGDEEEPVANDVRYLCRRKANYSEKDWRRFTFKCGVLVPDEQAASGGMIDTIRRDRADRAVLDGLAKLQARGLDAQEGSKSPQYLPRLLLEYKLADGLSKSELGEAMRRLVMDGRIKKAQVGKYPNRSPRYGLTAG